MGTTPAEDSVCAQHLGTAIALVLGLLPEQVNIIVTTVSQEEVDLHFGVYERTLAEKHSQVQRQAAYEAVQSERQSAS